MNGEDMEIEELLLDSNIIDIADIGKRLPEKEVDTHTEDGVPIRKLYVGNLPKCARKQDLLRIFKKYGDIESVLIRRQTVHHTYAFVTFIESQSAIKVLNEPRSIMFKPFRKLRVAPADSWHQPDFNTNFNDKESQKSNSINQVSSKSCLIPDDELMVRKPLSDNATSTNEATTPTPPAAVTPEADIPEEEDANTPSINVLNDDCLLAVFAKLSLRDRVRIESVCRRWRELCYVLWNNERKLSLDAASWGSWHFNFTTQCLRSLLMRCGHSLRHLDLADKSSKLNTRTLQLIAKHCPNLEYLNISGLTVSLHGTTRLARTCVKLRELHMEHCPGTTDKELRPILISCQDLEVIDLSKNSKFRGYCLDNLSANIKEINLMHCTSLEGEKLVRNLGRLDQLLSLNLDTCVTLRNYTIKSIVECAPQLKHLVLSNYMPLLSSSGLECLSQLSNLQTLKLNFSCAVSDRTLELISKGCLKLEMLDISCSRDETDIVKNEISDDGVGVLALLPNLKVLFIGYLKIGDRALEMLSSARQLLKLQCRGCPAITDRGCKAIIEHCDQLTELDVSGCELITKSTIDHAVQVLDRRLEKIPLCLYLGGTDIDPEQVPKPLHPLLEVLYIDLSVKHLRPDFNDDFFSYSDELLDDSWSSDPDNDWGWDDFDSFADMDEDVQEFFFENM